MFEQYLFSIAMDEEGLHVDVQNTGNQIGSPNALSITFEEQHQLENDSESTT
jgi:hypothetical protein